MGPKFIKLKVEKAIVRTSLEVVTPKLFLAFLDIFNIIKKNKIKKKTHPTEVGQRKPIKGRVSQKKCTRIRKHIYDLVLIVLFSLSSLSFLN